MARKRRSAAAGARHGDAGGDEPLRHPSLDIDEDLGWQRRDWLAQRVGWALLASIVIAGLAGLTGSGPLSRATSGDGRGLTVLHERYVRHGARTALTTRIEPGANASDVARIRLSRGFLEAIVLQQIVPEPESRHLRGDEVEFLFRVEPRAGLEVRWIFEPDALGRQPATVGLNDGPRVDVSQFTLP